MLSTSPARMSAAGEGPDRFLAEILSEGWPALTRFLLHRLFQTLIVVIGVTVLVFFILRVMPGDPVQLMFGDGDDVNIAQSRENFERALGLDQPLPVQYLRFLTEILQGDFGVSIVRSNEPVISMIRRALPITLELTLLSLIVALVISVPVAVLSALKQNTFWDRGATALALVGVSMPSFWQAILLIMVLSVWIPIFPVSGVTPAGVIVERITGMPLTDAILGGDWRVAGRIALHLVLPAVTLGSSIAGQFVRVLRSSLLEVKHQDFVDALRARGLKERTVVWHMLLNALPTTAVVIGMRIGTLLSGAIVIETVFAYPGMGNLLIQAINSRDFPVVQGVVIILTLLVILSNLAADIVHGLLDPRIKLGSGKGGR